MSVGWRRGRRFARVSVLVLALMALLAAPAGSVQPSTINATEHILFSGPVLTVPGTCTSATTVNWGDGTADSTGTGASSGGQFTVSGTHLYELGGTYHGTVTFTPVCGNSATVDFTADVADQPITGAAVAPPITLITGQPYSGNVATFTDANPAGTVSQYSTTIDWGDGSAASTGTISQQTRGGLLVTAAFQVAGSHAYSAPGSYPVTVTIKDAGGAKTVVTETATVSNAPSGVAFTISPNTDPTLSRKTLTFAITNPTPGVTYEWDFGDTDSPTGSTGAPFIARATGDSVTYAYPDPPIPASQSPTAKAFPGGAGTTRFAVYVVRVTALVPGHPNLTATPQNLVVVPVQPPTASFQVLRGSAANGGTGEATAVTHPVTIVPQAALPGGGSAAPDQIVREDFWFNLQGGTPQTAPAGAASPDLTCLSDGVCGHYTGNALAPPPYDLTSVAGQQGLGIAPLTPAGAPAKASPCGVNVFHSRRARPGIAHCVPPVTVSPTGGFESFSINFWNNALGAIGSPSGLTTLPQEERPAPPLVAGYPPLTSVNLAHDVDGLQGAQGIPFEGCFPGYPIGGPYAVDDENCDSTAYSGEAPVEAGGQAVAFGPYDLAHYGINSTQQLEDQFNFLYNYATVVGKDTNLDDQFGPATGASEGSGKSVIPRTITMVVYNAEGVPSAPVTENVPLTPATNPTLQLCVADVTLGTPCVSTTGKNKKLPFTITAGDKLNFDTSGSSGGTDPILYYAAEVGQPNTTKSWCPVGRLGGYTWQLTPSSQGGSGPPTKPTGPGVKHPFAADGAHAAAVLGNPNGSPITVTNSRTPVELTPWPMPAFSDLEAGAFPYHDCGSYAIRTVNGNAPPRALPKSGPNVVAHPAAVTPHFSPGGGTTTVPTGPGYKILPAPTVANPVLITTHPTGLNFTFPATKPGIYSVAVAAYNSSGLGAITRIDGFQAEPGRNAGQCEQVNSASVPIKDPNLKHSPVETLGFSGSCVTVVTKGRTPVLYASTTAIDLNGAPLVPSPGDSIVVNPASGGVYVTRCSIKTFKITGKFKNPCPDPSGAAAGSLYLGLGIGLDQKPPGIAYVPHFNAAQADKTLGPLAGGSLATLGKNLPRQSAKPVAGCGLYPGSQQWAMASRAQYDGFNVATKPCVTFSGHGQSRIAFWDSLPSGFGDAAKHQPSPTSQVVLQGQDVPAVSSLQTNQYANVARAQRGARPRRVIAGSPASFPQLRVPVRAPAHAADANLPGFPKIPSCPPSTNGKSGLSIPDGTDLGPISIPAGVQFCLDPRTGDFIGNLKVDIPGPIPISGVEVGFEIGHGRLIDAGGEVSGNIPVFPAVFINDFKFDVQTNPTEVAAAITASIADVLDVEGGLIIKPQTPEVDFEGSVSIFGFQFGNFAIDYVKNTVGMHVTIGKDFGPASINITVSGAMAWSPSFAFYLEGKGSACLFICIGVDGLISNQGLAACGSINLLFVTLSAGFAVTWSGPQSGVHLFTGCDLTPYIPAELKNVKGAALDTGGGGAARAAAGGPQPTLLPGGSEQLRLYHKGDCTPAAQTHCRKTVAAVQVHSLLSSELPGETPIVTLTGPAGKRVIQTPALPGYYGFQSSAQMSGGSAGGQTDLGTSLVDQNPVPTADTNTMSSAYCPGASATSIPSSCPKVTTTTLFVAEPAKGLWTLSVGADSPPVVDASVAHSQPAPKKKDFNSTVHVATLKAAGAGFDIGIAGHEYSSNLLSSNHLVLAQSVQLPPAAQTLVRFHRAKVSNLDVPPIDVSRMRGIVLKVPPGFQGMVTVLDHGPTVDQVIASGIRASAIPAGGLPIVFTPSPDFGGMHHVEAFLENSAGMPDRTIMLNSFKSPRLPKPKPPKILKILRVGTTVDVYFAPGNAPVASGGVGLALATAGGQQFDDTFAAGQLHAIGRLTGIGAAKQAREYMVSIPQVDPTEKINVGLAGFNQGVLGSTGVHSMKPVLASVPERVLVGSHGGARVLFATRR
jgi:hypothetical protein